MSDFTELDDRRPRRDARRPRLGPGARSPGTSPPTSSPSAVAFVESAADVAATVRFAAAHGLKVAAQGTGHGAVAAAARSTETILLKTERMRGIEIDPDAQHRPGRGRRARRWS